jgi:hypothetical protein
MGSQSPSSEQQPPVTVFFGPVYPELTESSLRIQQYLCEKGSAGWLDDTLEGLPSVWEDIVRQWPALKKVSGESQLRQLTQYLRRKSSLPVKDTLNFLLIPVTVLRHIMEFQKLKDERKDLEIRDVQGFCVGVLAAITACWEHDDAEFPKVVSMVLRLAVCIGALVDLDELNGPPSQSMAVRWKTKCEHRQLGEVLERYKVWLSTL